MSRGWKHSIVVVMALIMAVPAAAGPKGNNGRKKPPPAPQTFTAPFALVFDHAGCAPDTPPEACDVTSAANATGVVRSSVSLEKTQPTVQSWRGLAWGDVGGIYQLTQPVTSLTVTANVHVDSATVEVLSPTNLLGDTSYVETFLDVAHGGCSACYGRLEITVVASRMGTATASDQDLQLTLEITNPSGPVPAGGIRFLSGIQSHAVLFDGPGSVSSAAEGIVTSIMVTPHA